MLCKVSYLYSIDHKWKYQGKNWVDRDWEVYYTKMVAMKRVNRIIGIRVVDQETGVKVFEKVEEV